MGETLSQRHERTFAHDVPGGALVPGSGNGMKKLDVATRVGSLVHGWLFRYSLKATKKKSITVTAEQWDETRVHAIASGCRPAMGLLFVGKRGNEVRLVAIDERDWAELLLEIEAP